MPKVSLVTIQNLDNPNTATSQINLNFNRIGAQIDLLLSRDGESPNQMLANLDMNQFRIINLPPPVSPTEPARHGDIQQYVDQAEAAAEYAETQADRAENEADRAEGEADEAAETLETFYSQYGGEQTGDPATDPAGNPVQNGFFYWNSTLNVWRFWTENNVVAGIDNVIAGADNVVNDYYMTYPMVTLRSLQDVDASLILGDQFLQWNAGMGMFIPFTLSAENVPFTPGLLEADDVQEALDEILDRTSLGRYDIAFWAGGLLENNELVFRMVANRTFWIPINATDSVANARVASNDEAVLTLYRNDDPIGTLTFDESVDGVFDFPSEQVFNPGDIFRVQNAAAADTTLRDISFTIAARR